MKAITVKEIFWGLFLVLASFFVTLAVLNYWPTAEESSLASVNPLQELTYNVAMLPHLSDGQTLDFSDGQNRAALISGWSDPEPQSVWSSGHSAFVGFILDVPAGSNPPKQAVLRATPLLVPGRLLIQRFQVWYQNIKLGDFSLESEMDVKIPLDSLPLGNGTPIILGFVLTDAKSLVELQAGNDSRLLALAVKTLKLSS
jgi:hypothetical protein